MSRCKLCDNIMKSSEIIYYPKQNRHEDLCKRCRDKIQLDMLEYIEEHIEEIEDEDFSP